MTAGKNTESIDQDCRRLLGTATTTIAVAGAASLMPAHPVIAADSSGSRTSKQGDPTVGTGKDTRTISENTYLIGSATDLGA
jgi:hypothetical protein